MRDFARLVTNNLSLSASILVLFAGVIHMLRIVTGNEAQWVYDGTLALTCIAFAMLCVARYRNIPRDDWRVLAILRRVFWIGLTLVLLVVTLLLILEAIDAFRTTNNVLGIMRYPRAEQATINVAGSVMLWSRVRPLVLHAGV